VAGGNTVISGSSEIDAFTSHPTPLVVGSGSEIKKGASPKKARNESNLYCIN
jgi:hypothetical protein